MDYGPISSAYAASLGRDVSYREFSQLANQFARLLLAAGISRVDHVGIIALNSYRVYSRLFRMCANRTGAGSSESPVHRRIVDYVLEKTRFKAPLVDPLLKAKLKRRSDPM